MTKKLPHDLTVQTLLCVFACRLLIQEAEAQRKVKEAQKAKRGGADNDDEEEDEEEEGGKGGKVRNVRAGKWWAHLLVTNNTVLCVRPSLFWEHNSQEAS